MKIGILSSIQLRCLRGGERANVPKESLHCLVSVNLVLRFLAICIITYREVTFVHLLELLASDGHLVMGHYCPSGMDSIFIILIWAPFQWPVEILTYFLLAIGRNLAC